MTPAQRRLNPANPPMPIFTDNAAHLDSGGTEEAVHFNSAAAMLHGVLTRPPSTATVAAVFVHGWSGIRGGPNRLFVHIARAMAADGMPSLRFDLRGRGESDGDGLGASLNTMAEDLEAAVAFTRQSTGCTRILLLGICSGANVAIGSLDRLHTAGIERLILYSAYPFSDGDSFGRDVGRTWHYLRVYWHKLRGGRTWRRLLRGELDFKSIFNVLFGHFKASTPETGDTVQKAGTAAGRTASATSSEGRFQEAPPTTELRKLRRDLPTLFVYGTADPDAAAARGYYQSYAFKHALPARFEEIPGADHNFSSQTWQERLLTLSQAFWREGRGDHNS